MHAIKKCHQSYIFTNSIHDKHLEKHIETMVYTRSLINLYFKNQIKEWHQKQDTGTICFLLYLQKYNLHIHSSKELLQFEQKISIPIYLLLSLSALGKLKLFPPTFATLLLPSSQFTCLIAFHKIQIFSLHS